MNEVVVFNRLAPDWLSSASLGGLSSKYPMVTEPPPYYQLGHGTPLYAAFNLSISAFNLIERQTALTAIDSIATLSENWDGFGSASIAGDIFQTASMFVSTLPLHIPTPEVSANPHGTISMEWENDLGRAHLEIGTSKYSLYFRRSQGPAIYRDGFINEIDQSRKRLLGAMYTVAPSQDFTINQIRLAPAA